MDGLVVCVNDGLSSDERNKNDDDWGGSNNNKNENENEKNQKLTQSLSLRS